MAKSNWKYFFLALAFVFLASGISFAQDGDAMPTRGSLRCGDDLVLLGNAKMDVLSKCGEPVERDVIGKDRIKNSDGSETRRIEGWIYNFGPSEFMYTLRFTDGKLTQIIMGPRGF